MSFGDALGFGLTPGKYRKVLERANAIAAWAPKNGLTYHWEDPYDLKTFPFAFLRESLPIRVFDVLAGSWKGTEVYLADYAGQDRDRLEGGYDSSATLRTIVMVPIPGSVPALLATGRGSSWSPRKFPKSWGYQKLELGDYAFDATFTLWTTNLDYARWALNDPAMRQWLVSRGKGFSFEMNQMNMLLIQGLAELEYLPSLLDFAVGLTPLITPQIWEWYPRPSTPPS